MRKLRIVSLILAVAALTLMLGSTALAYPASSSGVTVTKVLNQQFKIYDVTVTLRFNGCTKTSPAYGVVALSKSQDGSGLVATLKTSTSSSGLISVGGYGYCTCGFGSPSDKPTWLGSF